MQMPPPDEERRPRCDQHQEAAETQTKPLAHIVRPTGCVCGCVNGVDCITDTSPLDRYRRKLGLDPLDRPDDWWLDPYADCRCQRGYWTGRGVFVCTCRQEVA